MPRLISYSGAAGCPRPAWRSGVGKNVEGLDLLRVADRQAHLVGARRDRRRGAVDDGGRTSPPARRARRGRAGSRRSGSAAGRLAGLGASRPCWRMARISWPSASRKVSVTLARQAPPAASSGRSTPSGGFWPASRNCSPFAARGGSTGCVAHGHRAGHLVVELGLDCGRRRGRSPVAERVARREEVRARRRRRPGSWWSGVRSSRIQKRAPVRRGDQVGALDDQVVDRHDRQIRRPAAASCAPSSNET